MVRKGIIFMEFIKDNNVPAAKLKDANLDLNDYDELYNQILITVRRLFQRCGLVKANLSEHTILIRRKRAVLAGTGRIVECNDPNASVLLRRGIAAITNFFNQIGVETAPMMRVFQFIIARKLEAGLHATLIELRKESETMSAEEFVGRFAPHTLMDVTDAEFAGGMIRIDGRPPFEEEEEEDEHEREIEIGTDCESESDDEEEDSEEDGQPVETLDRKRFTKAEWKEKVREIKQANRERRQAHKPRIERRQQNRRSHHNAK
jgi:serine/threonine-protein kinase RIO1